MEVSPVVQASIAEWQKRLLQLDRRNNLLYFKQGSRSAVRLLIDDIDLFLNNLGESKTGLRFDYAERKATRRADAFDITAPEGDPEEPYLVPGEIRTDHTPLELQPRLRNLRRKDREWQEEQGVNVLFLAVGFVSWIDEDSVEGKAPLLLIPCDLEQASLRDPFALVREADDIVVNVTLAYKLSTLGIHLPEFDEDLAPSAYITEAARVVRSKPGWIVTNDVLLSTFQYSKMAMWNDLERLREEGVEQELVRSLAGDPTVESVDSPSASAVFNQPIDRFAGGRLDDELDARDQLLVLRADYSQLLAVAAARSGGNLVIHGPPGTGKSQTIANIIGALIADGKTVLFVSEKTAALDVVKRRLEESQLGVLCLDLHSERGKKASVYEQFKQSLEDGRVVPRDGFDWGSLLDLRRRLNDYVRCLHLRRQPLNDSVYRMHGRFARLKDAPDVPFVVQVPQDLDDARLGDVLRASGRLALRRVEFAEHFTSIWLSLRATPNRVQLADELKQAAIVALKGISAVAPTTHAMQVRFAGTMPESTDELVKFEAVLHILRNAPGVPKTWLEPTTIGEMDGIASTEQKLQRLRAELLATLAQTLGDDRRALVFGDLSRRFDTALEEEPGILALLGENWSSRFSATCDVLLSSIEELPKASSVLANTLATLAETISARVPTSRGEIRTILSQAADIGVLAPVPECWVEPARVFQLNEDWIKAVGSRDGALDPRRAQSAVAVIALRARDAHELLKRLVAAEGPLLDEYSDELIDTVDREMLVRYRVDYRSFFKRLGGQYKRDQRVLKGARLTVSKVSIDDATSVVESALKVQELRRQWIRCSELLPAWLGAKFSGRETDWSSIQSQLASLSILLAALDLTEPMAKCLSDPEGAPALRRARDTAASAFLELERHEQILLGKDRSPSDSDSPMSVLWLSQPIAPAFGELMSVFKELRSHVVRWPLGVPEIAESLAIGARLDEIDRDEAQRTEVLRRRFGARYQRFDTDWDEVRSAVAWAGSFFAVAPKPLSSELQRHAETPSLAAEYEQWGREISSAATEFDRALAGIDAKFSAEATEWKTWRSASWHELAFWLERVRNESDRAGDWLQYRELWRDLDEIAGTDVLDAIRRTTDDAKLIPGIVERRHLGAWLEAIYANEPALRTFSSNDQADLIGQFREVDTRVPIGARGEIRQRAFAKYPDRFAGHAGAGQLGTLRDQLSRKRRQLPVRKLLEKIPGLAQALKPCFMMSPLAVSQFLPKGSQRADTLSFDAVIFDEASQVFPEDAIPAIARANQVIVVGDERQLPPTGFFRKDMDDDTDDDGDDEVDALKARESILDVMVGMQGRGVGERSLVVHYRSRHENLIRFSNHFFYRNQLMIYPSPILEGNDLGLRHLYLSDGRYDSGQNKTQTNRREAEMVVDLVFEHMRSRPIDESIGVVTLSRKQADLIEFVINERRMIERDIDQRFDESNREPFFVKNLENVQGDERDHIILSIGYGPTVATGAVFNNFGPINKDGGQRRLNVAISRARKSMTTVYSLRPSDIKSETPGARLLRRYLEFIENPESAFDADPIVDPDAEPDSVFEEAVEAALTSRGHIVRRQVGVAGYRIDLAIQAADGTRFDLGIECDGWTYHSSPAARDRDWLRQSILEGLGWRIHRIWSTAWIRNPEEQVRAIEAALELARVPSVAGGSVSAPILSPSIVETGIAASTVSSTAPTSSDTIFAVLEEASLDGLRHGTELQYATITELEPMLLRIAAAEGPVHIDVAVERIRAH